MNLSEVTQKKVESDFMFGDCGSFAIALQKMIGGDIYALARNEKTLHVFVKANGRNYDVKGPRGTYSMAIDCVGNADGFSIDGPLGNDLPVMINSKKIQMATDYINANKHIFGL
jgi:hypothetical protein